MQMKSDRDPAMSRYMVAMEYDGSFFHGFQKQKEVATVQGSLESALLTLTGREIATRGAGRTDTGVHALGQAVSFDIDRPVDMERFVAGLNALLGEGASVTWMRAVPDDFDPRREAVWREYRYLVLNRDAPSALLSGHAYHLREKVRLEAARQACTAVVGEHDFSSFVAGGVKEKKSAVRTVQLCDINRACPEIIIIRVRANSFLYKMVRILSGAILSVGTGGMEMSDLNRRLEGGDGPCCEPLPSHGLYLWEVKYHGARLGE